MELRNNNLTNDPHLFYIFLSLTNTPLKPQNPSRKHGQCSTPHTFHRLYFGIEGWSTLLFTRSIRVADLMTQHPNHFLCDSSTLQVGQRIHGLATDEELEPRRLYSVIPMELLYSVLTYEEMSALTYKATKTLKHGNGFNNLSRIFPDFTESCIFPGHCEGKRTMEDTERGGGGGENDDFVVIERYGKQRSWRSALETIVEC